MLLLTSTGICPFSASLNLSGISKILVNIGYSSIVGLDSLWILWELDWAPLSVTFVPVFLQFTEKLFAKYPSHAKNGVGMF